MTTVMNEAVEAAFEKAGKKPPSMMERIHLWLKDHPHKTSAEVTAAFPDSPTSSVGSLISQMYRRGMLARRQGERHGYGCWEWAIVSPTYELLPPPKSGPEKRRAAKKTFTPKEPVVVVPPTPAPTMTKPALPIDVESLTIAQARELYKKLKAMFAYTNV